MAIDHAFITDYEFWLRSVRNCANNTAVKYIKNFNKIIKICLANDWLDKNPFANYKSKVKEVERINEQAYGTPPSNPDAKIVYDWILQNANTGKLIFQDVYRLKKMSLSESQTYADMAIEYFRKNAPGNILEQANVRKMLGLVNWVNNDGDTRYIELRNSLLAVCSNIIKDAVQSVRDEMSGKTNRQQAQNQAQQQQPTTANKVYNNRRYVICPST